MNRTESGLEIVKTADSTVRHRVVSLTRKTMKNGKIRHGVVLTSKRSGRHIKVGTFDGIAPAWNVYKSLAKLDPA